MPKKQRNFRLADRPTTRPTAFILVHKFLSVTILKMGSQRRLAHPLKSDQLNYLRALGLDQTVFTTPPGKSRTLPMKT